MTELVSLDRARAWLRGWREIERQARLLRWFEPLHVPGLLRTEAYARAVVEAGGLLEPEEVERRLVDRMESQGVLSADEPLRLVAVIDGGSLPRRVGTRKTMCDQVSCLARSATAHPRVRIHVAPRSAEEYPGLNGVDRADGGGGGVVELTGARWRTSTRSGQNDQCVEVATGLAGDLVGVRDSKDRSGPVLAFDAYSWRVFLAGVPRR
jgi:hypothetical protein